MSRRGTRVILLAMRLSNLERAVTLAVFDAVLPGIAGGAPAARDHDLLGAHERMLAGMPRPHALGFRAAFVATELGLPLAMLGRLGRFSRLGQADRIAALERVVKHRAYLIRQVGLLFKTAAGFAYFQVEGVRAHFGLPPVAA